jgi:hypothetical protein
MRSAVSGLARDIGLRSCLLILSFSPFTIWRKHSQYSFGNVLSAPMASCPCCI